MNEVQERAIRLYDVIDSRPGITINDAIEASDGWFTANGYRSTKNAYDRFHRSFAWLGCQVENRGGQNRAALYVVHPEEHRGERDEPCGRTDCLILV